MVTTAYIWQFKECIQFSIQFASTLWSFNKITEVEYGLIYDAKIKYYFLV